MGLIFPPSKNHHLPRLIGINTRLGNMTKLFILTLVSVIFSINGAPEPGAGAAIAGTAVAQNAAKLVDKGLSILNSIPSDVLDNEALYCAWNDWASRDQRAHIECTYGGGRFSRQHRTLGIPNGRWYCVYKQEAYEALGHTASC